MPADVISMYGSLQEELNQAKGGLFKLDENIKKIIQTSGRYKQDRVANKQNSPNVFPNAARFNENNNNDPLNNSSFNNRKRPNETKTVFSRLSRKVTGDSDVEEEPDEQNIRARISSQVTRTLPTKQEVLRAQLNADPGTKKDNAEVCRARRVFGSLLGTLRAFCKEEALARDKEVFARRVSLEQKIECKASVEAAELANQRRNLILQREQQVQKIKTLELQMHRVQSHEVWEKSQKQTFGFIKTSAKPPIYWSPGKPTDRTKHLLGSTQHQLRKTIEKRRRELEADLEVISSKRLMRDKPKENEEDRQSEKATKDAKSESRSEAVEEPLLSCKIEAVVEEPKKMEVEEVETVEAETYSNEEKQEVEHQKEETEQTEPTEQPEEKQEPE